MPRVPKGPKGLRRRKAPRPLRRSPNRSWIWSLSASSKSSSAKPSTHCVDRKETKRLSRSNALDHAPARTCVGCRHTFPQAALVRFVRGDAGWVIDLYRRAPGRGVYLCSAVCGTRVAKNKRYPGLSAAAEREADELRRRDAAMAAEEARERDGDR
ncbi:DUF448 domain-containing protein [bacterium]|nr:MAG: DUF448 domain-containing protein [bacterium]